MASAFFKLYTLICILFAAFDFYYSYKAFRKPQRVGRAMGWTALFAGCITLAYLGSVSTHIPLVISICSSLYFISIDCMLVSLLRYAWLATRLHESHHNNAVMLVFRLLCLADILVLLINIPTGVAVGYIPLNPVGIAYDMKLPYFAHLALTYAMVATIAGILIYKSANTPKQYRGQYQLILWDIVIIVAINAIYLLPIQGTVLSQLDISILGYSIGLFLMYWAAFDYREHDMLRYLTLLVVQRSSRATVLFDYQDRLIMTSDAVDTLLKSVNFEREMEVSDFMAQCGLVSRSEDQYVAQCDLPDSPPLRCDFTRLRDGRSRAIGSLFIFTDMSRNNDITTGFSYSRHFRKQAAEHPELFDHPVAVAVFDIIALREINRTRGRDAGDRQIRELAMALKEHMPQGANFLRGYEANLIAIVPYIDEAQLRTYADQVVANVPFEVMYGLCAGDGKAVDIVTAIDTAYRSARTKKLLTPGSTRSQTLSSLVRALEEADSDTEAHVRRTQKMGALLGQRIHLTDVQLSDLDLLCLLHDIGKIGIPLEILNKPGRLTSEEWAVLRTHPDKGYQIAMSSDEMRPIAEMIRCHHERWDGNGYPLKLSGDEIPILSRIIAIVDAYDAMVNDRGYRKALTPEAAQAEIERCAGTQFDPHLSEEFLQMLREHPEIAKGEVVGGKEIKLSTDFELQQAATGNAVPIAFSRYVLDIDDVIIEVDARFETLTGYTAQDAVNRMHQIDLIPPEDRAFYLIQVNNQLTHGSIAYIRHDLMCKDGRHIQVACCGKRYFDSAALAFKSEILIFQLGGQ